MDTRGGKKIMVLLMILNISLIAVFYLFFAKIKSLNESISSLEQQVAIEEEKELTLRSIKAVISDRSSDIERVDSYFVGEDGVVSFIETIEKLARDNGLTIVVNTVNLNQQTRGNASNKSNESKSIENSESLTEFLELGLSTGGSWQNQFNFLAKLENLPYKISIFKADLSLAEVEEKDDSPIRGRWRGSFIFEVSKLK